MANQAHYPNGFSPPDLYPGPICNYYWARRGPSLQRPLHRCDDYGGDDDGGGDGVNLTMTVWGSIGTILDAGFLVSRFLCLFRVDL